MRRERGFTYLGILFAVAVLGVAVAATGQLWHFAQQRETERELLFIGQQFRQAIGQYYSHTPEYSQAPGPVKRYPVTLEALLRDPRFPNMVRHLRKLYVDPMTGRAEWGTVMAPDGGIMGVYSLSEDAPIKVANFRDADRQLEGKTKYSEWKFVYIPKQYNVVAGPSQSVAY
jgi:type II secretory pathway pseudopilin PulG